MNKLSEEEIANLVLDRAAKNKKQYYVEHSNKYEAKNEKEKAIDVSK